MARSVGRRDRPAARDEQLPRVHRADLPRPVRVGVRARHQPAGGHDQEHRGLDHRRGVRPGSGAPAGAAAPVRAHRRRRGLRSRRAGGGPAADPRRAHRGGLRAGRRDRRPAALRRAGLQAGEAAHRPPPRADGRRGHPVPPERGDRPGRHLGAAARPVRRRRGGDRGDRPARAAAARARARGHPPGDGVPAPGRTSRTPSTRPASTSSSSAAATPVRTASAPRCARVRRP